MYLKRSVFLMLVIIMNSCANYGNDYKTLIITQVDPTSSLESNLVISENEPFNNRSYMNPYGVGISQFVRRIYQDKTGSLWLGTNGDGVVRYTAGDLEYFSLENGFGGIAVRGIIGDDDGNIWFGTSGGLTKYDGIDFTNYTVKDGLADNNVWSLEIDSKGLIWVGTFQGVSCFDGTDFNPFFIPESEPDNSRGVRSTKIIHCILEDSEGKMWFAANDGAYIYDGKELTNLSKKDGLAGNAVNCILEAENGDMWFATHHNGISRYDGNEFFNYTKDGMVKGLEVWDVYQDKNGDIWFPAENYGLYRYNDEKFTNYQEADGLLTNAIQCSFQDRDGGLWFGGYTGLYRFENELFYPVLQEGPARN